MSKSKSPREYTDDEVQAMFLKHCSAIVNTWAEITEQGRSVTDALEGCVFSILAAIDGSCIDIPSFSLCPRPHPNDQEYHRERGENWFPEDDLDHDIGGSLHERWYKFRPKKEVQEGARSPLKPPTIKELECLIMWPKGSEGWHKEHAALELILDQSKRIGFGRFPQLAQYVRGLWDHPELAEKHLEAQAAHLKLMSQKHGKKA